jgi:DnaD/phage-associated family protein
MIRNNDDLSVTLIENIFINHYMPKAPGDFVKVYLLGLKYCQSNSLSAISDKVIAKSLNLLESDVIKAWKYWESEGIVKVESPDEESTRINYFNIASLMLEGKKLPSKKSVEDKNTNLTREMYKTIEYMFSRPLSTKELQIINSWIEDLFFTPELVTLLVEYCIGKQKKDFNYMNKVALTWYDKKIKTYDDAMSHIDSTNTKWANYYKIMHFLGFNRQPSKAETEYMDKWLDEYKMSLDMILEGCRKMTGLNKPNFRYLNTVLKSWHEKGYTAPDQVVDDRPATKQSPEEKDSKYDYDLIQKKLREKMWSDKK